MTYLFPSEVEVSQESDPLVLVLLLWCRGNVMQSLGQVDGRI